MPRKRRQRKGLFSNVVQVQGKAGRVSDNYIALFSWQYPSNFKIVMTTINTIPQEEEDEKLKKPKTIDAKEAQKVKERKKKELEDVS